MVPIRRCPRCRRTRGTQQGLHRVRPRLNTLQTQIAAAFSKHPSFYRASPMYGQRSSRSGGQKRACWGTAPSDPHRGEVWLVDFGEPVWSVTGGFRPALVVWTDALNEGPAGVVLVVPITPTRCTFRLTSR
ncbi:MAG: type II toxin-antitoxin system PemK/MazF family toxin [Acidimicrobiia bacterium]